jgi:hypothetical protein
MKKRSQREIERTIPTEHNTNSSIKSLSTVFICNKCNKYNTIFGCNLIQNCLYCNNPNYIKIK